MNYLGISFIWKQMERLSELLNEIYAAFLPMDARLLFGINESYMI